MPDDLPQFVTDASGRKRPVVTSGIEPETIMNVQVVRDAHMGLGGRYSSRTVERIDPGKDSVGNTLGSFVLGTVNVPGKPGDIDLKPAGQVRFPGTTEISRKRFRRLVPESVASSVSAASAAPAAQAPPVASLSEWVLCVMQDGEDPDTRTVEGRMMTAGDVRILQVSASLPLYKTDSRIAVCPADVEDPDTAVYAGFLVACVPAKGSCSLIFRTVPEA